MKKIREMQKDKIYAQPKSPIDDFRFDDDIANVFEDMVQRSIPGYNLLLAKYRGNNKEIRGTKNQPL